MSDDKVIKLKCSEQTTVEDALDRAVDFAKNNNVNRVTILIRFDDNDVDNESLGFFIGNNTIKPFTNAMLAWDLEQTKIGLFNGYFEDD